MIKKTKKIEKLDKQDIKKLSMQELIEKIDDAKKVNPMDLSADQDLSIAIMNLISIEEHLIFSGARTQNTGFYDLVDNVREMRKELMLKMIKNPQGEVWCISKHLLAASMRVLEVGTKELARGHKKEAYDLFQKSYDLYSLFWGLNMNLIDTKGVKKIDDKAMGKCDIEKKGVVASLGDWVRNAVNCCKE